jgi:hypothetical protein
VKLANCTVFLLVLIFRPPPALAAINYSKTVELPPLRISYAELQVVVDKAASLMNATNGSIPLSREEMDLRKKELRVQMSGHRMADAEATLPAALDRFEYTAWTKEETAPVSRLNLSFSNYSRTLSVQGTSPDQVDAIFSALRDKLASLSTPFGGDWVGFVRGVAVMILAMGLLFLADLWRVTRRRIILGPALLMVALLLALILLPIGDLFAGFTVVKGDASFMVRYGAQISFWGLMVGVVALVSWLVHLVVPTGRRD